MSEAVAILGTAFLCGLGVLLGKLCRIRETEPQAEYVLLTKEQYETLKNTPAISVQPVDAYSVNAMPSNAMPATAMPANAMPANDLPDYTEKAPLLEN
jgi:hypothetical protein